MSCAAAPARARRVSSAHEHSRQAGEACPPGVQVQQRQHAGLEGATPCAVREKACQAAACLCLRHSGRARAPCGQVQASGWAAGPAASTQPRLGTSAAFPSLALLCARVGHLHLLLPAAWLQPAGRLRKAPEAMSGLAWGWRASW